MTHAHPVGREHELHQLYSRVEPGTSLLIALVGEAGIGKSTLLEETGRRLQRHGWLVLWGRATRELPALSLGTRQPGVKGDWTLAEDVLADVAEATVSSPVCVIADDLQWADHASVGLLRSIRTNTSATVIFATRTFPTPPHLAALLDEADQRIEVGPLADAALYDIATARGADITPDLRAAFGRCGGNPLLAELVVDTYEDGTADLVSSMAEQRLRDLSADAQLVIRTASVISASVVVEDLAAALGRTAASLLPACDEALRAGLLRSSEGALHFRHDIVREAVYESIPSPLRRAMHGDLARLLAAAGRPRLSLCHHRLAAAGATDAGTFEFVVDTAQEIVVGAPKAALELLERALHLAPAGHPRIAEAQGEIARAATWSGVPSLAVEVVLEALSRPQPPVVEFALRTRLLEAYESLGDMSAVEDERKAREAILRLPERLQLWARVEQLVGSSEPSRVHEIEDINALAERERDPELILRSLAARYKVSTQLGEAERQPDLGQRLIRAADELWATRTADSFWPVAEAHWLWADEAWRTVALDDAIARARYGLHLAENAGAVGLLFTFQAHVVEGLLVRGDWDDATAEATTAVMLASDYGGDIQRFPSLVMLAWLAFHRDDLDSAERLVTETAGLSGVYKEPWRTWTEALLAEARGDVARALELLRVLPFRLARPHTLRLATLAGRRDIVEEVGAAAAVIPGEGMRPTRVRCQAWVELSPELMMEAAELHEQSMLLSERPAASEDVAVLLSYLGREREALPWLVRALDGWGTLGATRDVARVAGALRKLGVRRPAPHRRQRPSSGWEALTETERRVVELVATGLTNPEIASLLFVTRRTVTTHLTSAFRKLGVTRRAELAALVAGRARRPSV